MNISGARLHLSARGMPRGGKERKRKTSSGSSGSNNGISSISSSSIGRSSLVASMYRGAVPWRTFDPK